MKTQQFQYRKSNSFDGRIPFLNNYILINRVCALIFTVLTSGLIFGFNQFTYASGPGAAWTINKPITLSPVTPSANFQVKINLNAGQYTSMKSDGSDLRFYDNANNNCQYWIETFNNAGASTIWVKVLAAGTSALTMYYGNAAASAVSNGTTTFDFFDDFTGPLTNWTTGTSGGSVIQSGSVVTLSNTNGGGVSISNTAAFTPASSSFFLETKHKEVGYFRNRFYATTSSGAGTPVGLLPTNDYGYFSSGAGAISSVYWNGAFTGNVLSNNIDYLSRWQITDGSTYNWSTLDYGTGATIDARTTTYGPIIRYISILVTEAASTSTIVDWVRVRQFAATEPVATVYISPFIMNASGTFIPPDNVLSVTVQAWGAGGGGAGNNNVSRSGSGGGGGAYATAAVTVVPGSTYFIGIGASGAAGTFASSAATTGGTGGSSWFNTSNSSAGALVLAIGGGGGSTTLTTGGPGGAAASCTPAAGAFSGGAGGANASSGTTDRGGGSGGSSAGTAAAGTNGSVNNTAVSPGATAPSGGGNGGSSGYQTAGAGFGMPPGGGGGGSGNRQSQNGGIGGTGQVKLTWATCAQPIATASNVANISCFGLNDGSITVTASGGISPYTFSVDGTTFLTPTPVNSTTRLFTGLIPNNPYRVKVKDSKGCISK